LFNSQVAGGAFARKAMNRRIPDNPDRSLFFLVSVTLLQLFSKLAVFYYEGALIAAVEASPDGRAVEDKKIDVCRTAFGTELYVFQGFFLLFFTHDRFLEFQLLLQYVSTLTETELLGFLPA
jgi:hypothetical protein